MGIRGRKQSHENEMSLKDLRERDRENKPIVLYSRPIYCSSSIPYTVHNDKTYVTVDEHANKFIFH